MLSLKVRGAPGDYREQGWNLLTEWDLMQVLVELPHISQNQRDTWGEVEEGREIGQRSLMHVPKQSARAWALTVHTQGWEGFVLSLEIQSVLVRLQWGCTR